MDLNFKFFFLGLKLTNNVVISTKELTFCSTNLDYHHLKSLTFPSHFRTPKLAPNWQVQGSFTKSKLKNSFSCSFLHSKTYIFFFILSQVKSSKYNKVYDVNYMQFPFSFAFLFFILFRWVHKWNGLLIITDNFWLYVKEVRITL